MIFKVYLLLAGYSSGESILKLIGLILLCVVIIIASFFTTKFVGRKQLGGGGSCNFEAIDAYRIDQNRYLQIIRVAGKYLLISVTKEQISLICELDEDQIKEREKKETAASFKEIFNKALLGKNKSDNDTNA